MSDSRLKKMTQIEREFKVSTNGIEADLIKIYQNRVANIYTLPLHDLGSQSYSSPICSFL